MQALINRLIPYRQQDNYASGQYVFVLIKTLDGTEIARLGDRGVDTDKAIKAIRQAALPVPKKANQVHHALTELNNNFYVLLTVPLVTQQNDVAAYVEAIFAVSEQEVDNAKARRLRATLISIGIVLLTTLLLYPTIVQLLNRVTRMSRQLLDANHPATGFRHCQT